MELSLASYTSQISIFLRREDGQHVTLARSELEVRHRCVWVLVLEINKIKDQLGIQ